MKYLAVFAALCALGFAHGGHDDNADVDESDVVVLTTDAFDEVLSDAPLALVEFYAPWCGHCKHLVPEWAKAATELKGKVPVCKVDATIEQELANKFGVRGYPTIKVFRNGEVAGDYQGPRTASGIVDYANRQLQPAVTELETEEEAKEFSSKDKVVVVGFVDEDDSASEKTFAEVASLLRDDFSFGVVDDDAVAKSFDVDELPSVVMFKNSDKEQLEFEGDFTKDAISAWVRGNSLPLVDEIGPQNYKAYVDTNLPMALVFVKLGASYFEDVLDTAREVAKNFRGRVNFVYVDADKYIQQAQKVGLSGKVIPSFAIDYVTENKHYAFSEEDELETADLVAFVNGVLDGSVAQTIKSEEIPEDNDGPVKVLVAKQFDEIVNDPTKDVFVEFYAPWCGHCKKLEPIFEELGESFGESKSIVIAKMDATANDVPGGKVNIRGFPTLVFFPANGKDAPLTYEGDRTLEALREYVVENADLPLDGEDGDDDDDHDDHEDL
jgi:protein disulfide-isomerase A1